MSQYAKLDKSILWVLASGGARQFGDLCAGVVWAECVRLEAVTGRDDFRILDGRLQALRRAGQIRYTGSKAGQGWELVKREQQ